MSGAIAKAPKATRGGLEATCPACSPRRVWEGWGATCTWVRDGRVCGNYRLMTTRGLERGGTPAEPSLVEKVSRASSVAELEAMWKSAEAIQGVTSRARRRWVVARDARLAQLQGATA